jgi:hypothetical protein
MTRHESPYHPGNSDLTALRRRQAKGKGMRRNILGIVGATMMIAGIVGIIATVSADGGGPSKSSYDLDDCMYFNAGWVCEGTPGVGTPEPVVTVTPTMVVRQLPTVTAETPKVIDSITELPSTGAGTTAQNTVSGADSGLHFLYRCEYGTLWRWAQWATWNYADWHSFYPHHHITSVEGRVAIGVCY